MRLSRAVVPLIILIALYTSAVALDGQHAAGPNTFQQLYDHYKSIASSMGEELAFPPMPEGKCGFPAVLQLRELRQRYGKIAGIDEALSRPPDSGYPETFDSPGGHFKIHYTTEAGNRNAVDPSYGDHNSNGVPDYVEITATICDSVWDHHINKLGYIEPKSDGTLGGDSRYDVYILDLPAQYYGETFPEGTSEFSQSSWLELDNHYENYQGYHDRPLDALRVTIAHEFFHAIHLTYDASEYLASPSDPTVRPYWFEMSAVWMEEQTYDNINDYYYYLPYYLYWVHKSPRYVDPNQLSIYGACLYPLYLSQKYGPDIVRIAWEKCGEVHFENFFIRAIQDAISEVSNGQDTFAEDWAEYTQWLYFTGSRARPGYGFEEAANYSEIPLTAGSVARPYIHIWNQYPVSAAESRDNSYPPSELGANYHDFRTASLDSTFGMQFQGAISSNTPIDWRISIVGFDRFNPNAPMWHSGTLYRNLDPINVTDLAGITDLLVVPTVANPEAQYLNQGSFAYQFIVADSSIQVLSDDVAYGPSKFHLANADVTPFRVFIRLRESQKVEIAFFSVSGEEVYSKPYDVVAGEQRALEWNGRNNDGKEVASGVYILQVRYGDTVEHHKILVL